MPIIVTLTPFIHSVFIGVSDRQEEHGNIRKLKETSRINEDIKNYKDWMKKAGMFGLASYALFVLQATIAAV